MAANAHRVRVAGAHEGRGAGTPPRAAGAQAVGRGDSGGCGADEGDSRAAGAGYQADTRMTPACKTCAHSIARPSMLRGGSVL